MQSEENTPRKRQKCDSECIPLKTVDYDNLSESSNNGLETNIKNLNETAKVLQDTESKQEQMQPDWTNFKSLLLKEGAFHLFKQNSDASESEEVSE